MLKRLIHELGVRRVARACGVEHGAVRHWCSAGLPSRPGDAERRAKYERAIAKMAGIKVGELRERIAEEEAETA